MKKTIIVFLIVSTSCSSVKKIDTAAPQVADSLHQITAEKEYHHKNKPVDKKKKPDFVFITLVTAWTTLLFIDIFSATEDD